MFRRFDTKHACDRQTELAWHIRTISYMLSHVKNEHDKELLFTQFHSVSIILFKCDKINFVILCTLCFQYVFCIFKITCTMFCAYVYDIIININIK